MDMVETVLAVADRYRSRVWNREVDGFGVWSVPLRRLLFHLALAYSRLEGRLSPDLKARFRGIIEQQCPAAIAHCRRFLPGVRDLHLAGVNNHTAVFMQGIDYRRT